MKREHLRSRLGFIMLSAGCAIGCGNVWKFPWAAGQNGGGVFLMLYIISILVLGLPALTIEFALGRAAQASPVKMYQKLDHKHKFWRVHGALCLLGNVCLMAFYTTVVGWIIYYFVSFAGGHSSDLTFTSMISNPTINVLYLLIAISICFAILTFDLSKGLENITKYMMSALLVLMIVLCMKSITLPNAWQGLKFYLVPDFNLLNIKTVVSAMNQAFFSLSVGVGSMAIFGSYINKDHSLISESLNVICLDTFVAIMAGLIIFPACASHNLEVTSGPALLFNTMTSIFNSMEAGRIWGTLFFLFMVIAAISTELAVCENILACVRELTGWSRRKGCLICGVLIFLLSLTTALGFSVFKFEPFGSGSTWLDFWDFVVSSNLLPIGTIIMAVFCTSKIGWGYHKFKTEVNSGKGFKISDKHKFIYAYFLPVTVFVIYVLGLIDFFK